MTLHKIIIPALTMLLAAGCNFLDEYSQDAFYPRTWVDFDELLIGEGYLTVAPGSEAATTTSCFPYIHFLADEMTQVEYEPWGLTWYNVTDYLFGYYTWQSRVGTRENGTGYYSENKEWNKLYEHINIANSIIAIAPDLPQRNAEEVQGTRKVLAEAHFLRAAYYFLLVNIYGKPYDATRSGTDPGVPLKLTEYIEDEVFSRNTTEEVYRQIEEDLWEAERLFEGQQEPSSIYRAGLTATYLLQSRMYLYTQRWADARDYAAKALARNSDLIDLNDHSGAILSKNSPESIFSMGGNSLPMNNGYNEKDFQVSHELYDAYETSDLRKANFYIKIDDFIGYTKVAGDPRYTRQEFGSAYRYYYRDMRAEVSEIFLLRTAEAYLNHAEACAYLEEDGPARKSLNTLRRNRFSESGYTDVTLSGEALVKEIREERRRELALEGHRWFDLRRYMVSEKYPESKPIVHRHTFYIMSGYYERPYERREYTLEPFDAAYTLNIPQDIIEFNTGMVNNPRPERNYVVVPL